VTSDWLTGKITSNNQVVGALLKSVVMRSVEPRCQKQPQGIRGKHKITGERITVGTKSNHQGKRTKREVKRRRDMEKFCM
jgi:hypothetical protein